MSQTMNWSTEITQFKHPLSYLFNSTTLDELPLNSFTSPRNASVTVIGKRIHCQSCISPSTLDEDPKFPIPIQVFSRIKRHHHQAKKLIKQRSNKIKFQEQPAPPSIKKNSSRPNPIVYKKRKSQKTLNSSNKSLNRPSINDETKPPVPLTERNTIAIGKIIKNTMQNEFRKKIKIELEKKAENEYKLKKKLKLEKQNSKIRLENLKKFRIEKFSPKAAWGIDQRKYSETERQKLAKEIENQRTARRAEKKSPGYISKQGVGLSNFLEIESELGFKPRSSSTVFEPPTSVIIKKESNPQIKLYIKQKKQQKSDLKTDQLIENIKKETRRIASLKLLDVKSHSNTKKPKKTKTKPKKFLKKPAVDEEKYKEEKPSSDLIFDPDSAMRQNLSGFSEETDQLNNMDSDTIQDLQQKAAIKIQSHIRKFLIMKKYKNIQGSYTKEDAEVKNIISAWQQSISEIQYQDMDSYNKIIDEQKLWQENQLESLQELKRKEINEVIEVTKSHTSDPKIIDSITKIIDSRYQHISSIFQKSIDIDSVTNNDFNPTSDIIEEEKEDSIDSKKNRVLDFSFPSYKSEKSINENSSSVSQKPLDLQDTIGSKNSPSDIIAHQDYIIVNNSINDLTLSEIKDTQKIPLVSRASPSSDTSDSDLPSTKFMNLTPETLCELSDKILSQCLAQELAPYKTNEKQIYIEKDPDQIQLYIQELIERLYPYFAELKSIISKPLRKNPLEILGKMNDLAKCYPIEWEFSTCPAIINSQFFIELDKIREIIVNEEIKIPQKIHDKMIFDNCNEFLQTLRPYGLIGVPAPWSDSLRILKHTDFNLQQYLYMLKVKIFELSNFNAGKIQDHSFLIASGGKEDGVQNSREEKLGVLIAEDINNREPTWINYELEETQTKLEVSDLVLETLISETINFLSA